MILHHHSSPEHWELQQLCHHDEDLLGVEEVQVNKDEKDEASKEEEDVEYLCMSLISLASDGGQWQDKTKYHQNVGIQRGHNLLQRVAKKISTLVR